MMDIDTLNFHLLPCDCAKHGQTAKPYHGDWYVSCWSCQSTTGYEEHAYQAVNEWNEARRGEK